MPQLSCSFTVTAFFNNCYIYDTYNFRIASRRCSGVGFKATDLAFNLYSKIAAAVVGPIATSWKKERSVCFLCC